MLQMLIPTATLERVAGKLNGRGPDAHGKLRLRVFDDLLISSMGAFLVRAAQAGAPDFYAHASAQWLAAHLLLGGSKAALWTTSLQHERISDYRLARVLEYMGAHLADRLSLEALAKEAGISPFHFTALFSKAVGMSPHKHVQHLRMGAAKAMPARSDKSILDAALSTGFRSAAHFGASFRKHTGRSPTEYRKAGRILISGLSKMEASKCTCFKQRYYDRTQQSPN